MLKLYPGQPVAMPWTPPSRCAVCGFDVLANHASETLHEPVGASSGAKYWPPRIAHSACAAYKRKRRLT